MVLPCCRGVYFSCIYSSRSRELRCVGEGGRTLVLYSPSNASNGDLSDRSVLKEVPANREVRGRFRRKGGKNSQKGEERIVILSTVRITNGRPQKFAPFPADAVGFFLRFGIGRGEGRRRKTQSRLKRVSVGESGTYGYSEIR
ncbi:hypothetical protein J3R74_002518 [Puniceicoccus vermicola]